MSIPEIKLSPDVFLELDTYKVDVIRIYSELLQYKIMANCKMFNKDDAVEMVKISRTIMTAARSLSDTLNRLNIEHLETLKS